LVDFLKALDIRGMQYIFHKFAKISKNFKLISIYR
jgi:hypothetical protein